MSAAETNRIEVEIWTSGDAEPITYKGDEAVHYISYVTGETYGIPALISDRVIREAVGEEPVTILYVNPGNIAAMRATRTA